MRVRESGRYCVGSLTSGTGSDDPVDKYDKGNLAGNLLYHLIPEFGSVVIISERYSNRTCSDGHRSLSGTEALWVLLLHSSVEHH